MLLKGWRAAAHVPAPTTAAPPRDENATFPGPMWGIDLRPFGAGRLYVCGVTAVPSTSTCVPEAITLSPAFTPASTT